MTQGPRGSAAPHPTSKFEEAGSDVVARIQLVTLAAACAVVAFPTASLRTEEGEGLLLLRGILGAVVVV